MSDDEIRTIIDKGLARLTMGIDDAAREDLVASVIDSVAIF